uniref:Spermidine synthase n=1 Tax=Desulfobacca acetoxidans TaxID=60893 RepID=A0A7C3WL51_9BACT
MPFPRAAVLWGSVLAYGGGALAGQVLILRELLVLCQGQELKLALGLWCWLFWTGMGSLAGGRLAARHFPGPNSLAFCLFLLGSLLPGTVLAARLLPELLAIPAGQSLGPGTALLLFLGLLAPFGLISGGFFPFACAVQNSLEPRGAVARVYATEALGAAIGIVLLQAVLMGRYANLPLSLGAGLALVSVAALSSRRLTFFGGVLALGIALLFAPPLDWQSRRWQWPGRQVVATGDSPYALLTVTREKEQLTFFANHVWHFTYPDPFSAEPSVHLALLEHPHPERVLLLGGGAPLISEALKHHSIHRLHYVELDPDLVRLAARFVPEAAHYLDGNPRVKIFYQDARRFLTLTDACYDVIIMNLPEPTNAQLNRYYSQEFFRSVARHLSPGGVFSFALGGGGGAGLNPARAAYLALGYNTLRCVFPEVLPFPGDPVRFFASPTEGALVADPEILISRLKARQLDLLYVREYYLRSELAHSRQQFLAAILRQQPLEVNSDLNPRGFFYDLVLTGSREGFPGAAIWLFLKGLPPAVPWIGLGFLCLVLWLSLRKRPVLCCLSQIVVMGLGTMGMEIAVLVLYQIYLGYLYRQLGLLIAAFMLGLAAGGIFWLRFPRGPGPLKRHLAGLQLTLAALALLLPALSAIPEAGPVLPEIAWQGGLLLLLALAGFAGGGIFSLSAALWRQIRPATAWEGGLLYAVDLLGATLGTLGMSLVALPVWGIGPALWGLAALHAFAAASIAGWR